MNLALDNATVVNKGTNLARQADEEMAKLIEEGKYDQHNREALMQKVARVAQVAYDIFLEHAMKLNLRQGKTEAMLMLRGPNANVTRSCFYNEQQSEIPFTSKHDGANWSSLTWSSADCRGKRRNGS